MATSWECTEGEMNRYRLCYIVTVTLTEGLQTILGQERGTRYKEVQGEWKDDLENGWDFWNGEYFRNRHRYARQLTTMRNVDRAKWDCAMLFYAILHLNPSCDLNPIQSNVDDLWKFRNAEFVRMPRGHLSSVDFQSAILKVSTAFHTLCLPTQKINEIQNQKSFPTQELRNFTCYFHCMSIMHVPECQFIFLRI